MRDETVNLMTFLVGQKQTEEIVAKLVNNIYLRKDLLDNVMNLIIRSSCSALEKERANEMMVNFMVKLVHNPKL